MRYAESACASPEYSFERAKIDFLALSFVSVVVLVDHTLQSARDALRDLNATSLARC
jgi:hypothetical protein